MSVLHRVGEIESAQKHHIQSIALDNGVFTEEALEKAKHDEVFAALLRCARNLKKIGNNATCKLAEDLNSTDTHFLLECIQNAADNSYAAGVQPFLRICARADRIQLDCNEVGFKRADVEAICKVGGSNKTSKEGFIGAKGIGFKSVFKIAQVVHIYSPPYSFKFDKTQELGMIIPIWVPEKDLLVDTKDDCQTSILLLPPVESDFTKYFHDFKNISPTLLLFLPKLTGLEVLICENEDGKEKKMCRKMRSSMHTNKRASYITLTVDNNSPDTYRKFKKTWVPGCSEPLREGLKTFDTVLAFPVSSEGIVHPLQKTREVHAFLPVRDFGFTFVIQADFIVTSSREEIDESKIWNERQRKCVIETFKDAILEFLLSHDDPLRYTWMRFLPRGLSGSFWAPAETAVWDLIRKSRVIESRAGSLHLPHELEQLSEAAIDRHGNPLLGSDSEYISTRYDEKDLELLRILGAKNITWPSFLTRLLKMTNIDFKSKSDDWHKDLAKTMSSQKFDLRTEWLSKLRFKTFIPLVGGQQWASMDDLEQNPIYFRDAHRLKVPSDISSRFVAESASNNDHRKSFFRLLGVKDYDQFQAASEIIRKHQGSKIPTEDEAVAHACYLHNLPSAITDKLALNALWLYDEQGIRGKGHALYVRDTSLYGPAALFNGKLNVARFLSPKYAMSQASKPAGEAFLTWLMKVTDLTNIPRLSKSGSQPSNEFNFILQSHPEKLILTLKKFWSSYEGLMKEGSPLLRAIMDSPATCFDGHSKSQRPLKNCFAPDAALKRLSLELWGQTGRAPFLLIEPYEAREWDFLSTFGVGLGPDLKFFLWAAKETASQKSLSLERAQKLLKYIADLTGFDQEKLQEVRASFNAYNILPVLTGSQLSFTQPSLCVWDGPEGFMKSPRLKPIYGKDASVATLLRTNLGVEDASVTAVIEDLASQIPSDAYLEEALQYIARRVQPGRDVDKLQKAFRRNLWIPNQVPGAENQRVSSSNCIWGGPQLSSKLNLETRYGQRNDLRGFFCDHLQIKGPTYDDILQEIRLLKTNSRTTTLERIGTLYAYIFTKWRGLVIRKYFETHALVCIQGVNREKLWKRPSDCVWNAPEFLRCKVSIARNHGYTEVSATQFLRDTIGISDASFLDYIQDLRLLRSEKETSLEDVKILYRKIDDCMDGHDEEVRKTFNEENLVFSPQHTPPRWVKCSDCVWFGPSCLLSTTRLISCYPSLDMFFQVKLGVKNAEPETMLNELRAEVAVFERTQSSPSLPAKFIRRIKDLIMTFKSGKASHPVLQSLRSEKLWPCQYWKDNLCTVALARLEDANFIPDHEYRLELFHKRIPTLNLSLQETLALMPLFTRLGAETKLLSNCVTERASAKDESLPSAELSQALRERAQALCCCARHLSKEIKVDSNENLYEMLKNIQVFQASDISTTYIIDKYGIKEEVTTPGQMRFEPERFDPNGDQLKLFVPRDQREQKHAFDTCLAREMMRFLGLSEPDSWQIITAVLSVEPARLNSLLQRQGILNPYATTSSHIPEVTVDTVAPNTIQIKRDSSLIEGETSALEKAFDDLALVPKQTANERRHDPASSQPPSPLALPSDKAPPRSRPAVTTIASQKVSSSIAAGMHHELVADTPSNSKPAHIIDGTDVARPIVEVRLEQSVLDPNDGSRPSDFFQQKQESMMRKAKASDLTSMSLVVTPPRAGRRSSSQSSGTSTRASSYSNDAPSYSSSSSVSSDTEKFNTPTKKPSKAKNQLQSGMDLSKSGTPANLSSPGQGPTYQTPRGGRHGGPDTELGYLGEKFIVEMLKDKLLDFDKETHWTSKLRRYENSPELPNYNKSEETDVTYPDTHGYLSRLLRSMTQGQVPSWLEDACAPECAARPTYWIEVKTTAGSCKTPFFVSEHQYDLMKTMSGDIPRNVYVLLRVFNIEEPAPGIRAYLDPWSESQNGGLRFSEKPGYTVTTC